MNIENIEDRTLFETEYLYPALKKIYSGILGSKRTPIICGSVALYLQGIYYDHFPKDIDIRFENYNDVKKYNYIYRYMCKKENFIVEFIGELTKPIEQLNEIHINDITIYIESAENIIKYQHDFYDYWVEHGNLEKAQKYIDNYNYLKEHYPQYFDDIENGEV